MTNLLLWAPGAEQSGLSNSNTAKAFTFMLSLHPPRSGFSLKLERQIDPLPGLGGRGPWESFATRTIDCSVGNPDAWAPGMAEETAGMVRAF